MKRTPTKEPSSARRLRSCGWVLGTVFSRRLYKLPEPGMARAILLVFSMFRRVLARYVSSLEENACL